MRILVTNDDGIDAPGLHALARSLHGAGHELIVAAPLDDRSGSGASIGRLHIDEHIDVEERELAGLEGVPAWGVAGPPALCVLAARLGGFGAPPELVVSGINPGCNTGRAVLHSGTVGAALTAANFGLSGLAVSIDVNSASDEQPTWATAGELAVGALEWLLAAGAGTVVNLNVPDVPLAEVLGVGEATLAKVGTVRSAVVESGDGRLQMELRATGEVVDPASDTGMVRAGYAAVTVIQGITAVAPSDVADHTDKWLSTRSG